MGEEWGDKIILYLYDASGSPIGMMYRTTSYDITDWDVFWFEKNLHGDVVAVYNNVGTKVATYNYSDAWGNHLVSYSNGGSSTGAQYNPFRYRGYYYDTDLGMYYLQSRYYDPNTCRFIKNHDYGAYKATANNIERMREGVAPKGWDGHSVQLHHPNGIANDFYNYYPVSRTFHIYLHIDDRRK